MNIFEFIARKMRSLNKSRIYLDDDAFKEMCAETYLRELAFWSCVNLISRAISKCEIKTFKRGKEVREREYYLWNVEPNVNQNSSGFLMELIAKLYLENECIVVPHEGQLVVAETYNREDSISGDIFTNITWREFSFPRDYRQNEVLHFKLNNQNMSALINSIYDSYSKLIVAGMQGYKAGRNQKAIFAYDSLPVPGSDEEKQFQELINERLKPFMQAERSVLPLGKGHSLSEYGNTKTVRMETSRDIRALVDDISDFTARSFVVPVSLLNGSVQNTDSATDQLLTFCIDPLADMLQEEINRKRNGYAGFIAGTRHQIDTHSIRHIDLLKNAANIDKLISCGVKSVNGIITLTGEPPINEPWANEHFMTKNYILARKMYKEEN